MKGVPAAVLAGAFFSAVLVACGSSSTPANTTAGGSAAPGQSCHAQYEAWKHGAAGGEIASLKSALRALQAAGQAQDLLKLRDGIQAAGRTASRLAANPPPRCADPHGYYGQLFAKITAAADNLKAASGLGAFILAAVPLKAVPAIEQKLTAELNHTVGVKR
jgi:hypothetical protein